MGRGKRHASSSNTSSLKDLEWDDWDPRTLVALPGSDAYRFRQKMSQKDYDFALNMGFFDKNGAMTPFIREEVEKREKEEDIERRSKRPAKERLPSPARFQELDSDEDVPDLYEPEPDKLKLTSDEQLVLDVLKNVGSAAISIKDLATRTSLPRAKLRKALRALEHEQELIASSNSVEDPPQKMYILVDVEAEFRINSSMDGNDGEVVGDLDSRVVEDE